MIARWWQQVSAVPTLDGLCKTLHGSIHLSFDDRKKGDKESPAKMKSPIEKELVGKQKNLPEGLKKAIEEGDAIHPLFKIISENGKKYLLATGNSTYQLKIIRINQN